MLIQTEHFQRVKRAAISRCKFRVAIALVVGIACFLNASTAMAAESVAGQPALKLPPLGQIFTFFLLMLGPIKIIGPFAKITHGAEAAFSRRLAFLATAYSCGGLLLAALVGESLLRKWGVPLHVLLVAGGIILFLVALQSVLQQYNPAAAGKEPAATPTFKMAMSPLAFPTIVTPYGIAALIIFVALSPTRQNTLAIGGMLLGVMVLNVIAMILSRHILRFLGVVLQILGSVLGILQIALGLQIIFHNIKYLLM